MPNRNNPHHFVVDGSNIATEGRSRPSLEQLNEAVLAFMKQYPDVTITVVVDATFGHRIDPKEVKAFDEAVANNELVAPPAGAIGRGDAFVLQIADQANAGVLSNDSFQEFHGDYEWLFDEGRLVGGKPVPNVGWVFVNRSPVRGPKSRASMRKSKTPASPEDIKNEKERAASRFRRKGEGKQPAKVSRGNDQKSSTGDDERSDPKSGAESAKETGGSRRSSRGRRIGESQTAKNSRSNAASAKFVNELMPFIDFVEHHPVGAKISATVDRYSSHGAYLRSDDVSLYLPLQFIADPAPNSARSVMALEEQVDVIVVGFQPDRRSVDVATPDQAPAALTEYGVDPAVITAAERAEAAQADAASTPTKKAATKKSAAKKSTAKKSAAKKAAAQEPGVPDEIANESAVGEVDASERTATSTAADGQPEPEMAPAPVTAAKKGTARKSATKKPTAKKTAAKKTTTKKSTAKKVAAKKSTAKKVAAKKVAAKKATAKKAASKRTPAKNSLAKKAVGKTAGTKKTTTKTATKKTAAKKTAGKKTAAKSPAK